MIEFLVHVFAFIGLLAIMSFISLYVPYGLYVNTMIVAIALWKLVNK